MIKNFKKETRLISTNNRLSEKLLTLAIYNEFYNDIMEVINENEKAEYTALIEKTFDIVVRKINNRNNRNVSAESFMKIYFSAIKTNKLFNTESTLRVINNIENSLSNAKSIVPFVPAVDNFEELTLDSKLNIILEFRDYTYNVWRNITEIFGENTTREFRSKVLNVLTNHLGKYLMFCKEKNVSPSDISKRIKSTMMKVTKKFLIFKLNKGDLAAELIPNTPEFNFFNNFNDLEQDIWLMNIIYEIAGFDDKMLNVKKLDEICDTLGISKIRYALTNISMGLNTLKTSKLKNNENTKKR